MNDGRIHTLMALIGLVGGLSACIKCGADLNDGQVMLFPISILNRDEPLSPDWPLDANRKYGYIDKAGSVVIAPSYTFAGRMVNNLARVEFNSRWGFLDAKGNVVIPIDKSRTFDFCEGLAVAQSAENGKFGYLNMKGVWEIPPQYEAANEFSEGLASISTDGQFRGYIDRTGRISIEPKYLVAAPFNNSVAMVLVQNDTGSRWHVIRRDGSLVFSQGFVRVKAYCDGLAPVEADNGKWGVIDTAGNFIVDPIYDEINNFQQGLAWFRTGDKYGYMDESGNVVISARYEKASNFCEGLAAVEYITKKGEGDFAWGYIDPSGTFQIKGPFYEADEFYGGLARVSLDQKSREQAYIDIKGRIVWRESEMKSH